MEASMAEGGIPLGEWSGSNATRELHETIKRFNESATRQTAIIIRLTWAIAILTAVMTVAVVVQICLALRATRS
jgi:hypothetical protein